MVDSMDQSLDNAMLELADIYADLKVLTKKRSMKDEEATRPHFQLTDETRKSTSEEEPVNDGKLSPPNFPLPVEEERTNFGSSTSQNDETSSLYDEVPSMDEENQKYADVTERDQHGDYCIPNSRPTAEIMYKSPFKFFTTPHRAMSERRPKTSNSDQTQQSENHRLQYNFNTVGRFQQVQKSPKCVVRFSDDTVLLKTIPPRPPSTSSSVYDLVPNELNDRVDKDDDSIPDYEEISDSCTEVDNTATLPYQRDVISPTSSPRNPFISQTDATPNSTPTQNGIKVMELTPIQSSIDQNSNTTLYGRYPTLKDINDMTSAEEASHHYPENRRTSKESSSSCGPPSVPSPTGSIIDTTIQKKRKDKKSCKDICVIMMAVSIVFSVGFLIFIIIIFIYHGVSLQNS